MVVGFVRFRESDIKFTYYYIENVGYTRGGFVKPFFRIIHLIYQIHKLQGNPVHGTEPARVKEIL
ncbi:hypothetical protein SAMN05192588_0440 [Nonlabens sp. Hel1_33_55]|uniref:hypothetical protein n=1 Tax=Nonlabens sp. Hel1_33_55 TaxID=1336802 RepID=UPI000875E3EF|nr:hypothetical protein [Nonlabens sp. Hel1_33_55]SCX95951.1 hypothetical protein SAMN05192588_0440 [Nonlabens sp. Hel1_33_55]